MHPAAQLLPTAEMAAEVAGGGPDKYKGTPVKHPRQRKKQPLP